MKHAGKIALLLHLALAARAQVFDRRALLAHDAAPRWEAMCNFSLAHNSTTRDWYARSDLGLSYSTALLQIEVSAHLNQSLSFAFRPPRLIIRVEGTEVEFSADTRFRARPDQYRIDQPFNLMTQFHSGRWTLFGSLAPVTQQSSTEIAEPNVIGDSLFFINWQAVNASNTGLWAALIAGCHWGDLVLNAGALNLALAHFGDRNFPHEYRPAPAPFWSLAWRYKTAQLRAFADQQALSFEFAQPHAFKLLGGKALEAKLGYQTGLEEFPFHAIHIRLAFPVRHSLKGTLGYQNVWSSQGLATAAAFASWQQTMVLGTPQPIDRALPQQAVFLGLHLALDKKTRPWPLQMLQIKWLQSQIYRSKRAFYAHNPLGTIALHNRHEQPVQAQIVLETSGGAGRYRTDLLTIHPGETIGQPLYLYLQDTDNDNVESFEQVHVSVVIENQARVLASVPVTIYGRNAWSGNTWELKYFVVPDDPAIRNHAKQLYLRAVSQAGTGASAQARFLSLQAFLEELGQGMKYVPDPATTMNIDQVQYPVETLSKRGGDCEDLAVFLASSLMAIGVQTAVVDIRPKISENLSFPTAEQGSIGHVFLLIDTGIGVEFMSTLGLSDFQGITRKNVRGQNTIWIPFEATELINGFAAGFLEGVQQYYHEVIENDGVSKGSVHVYDF